MNVRSGFAIACVVCVAIGFTMAASSAAGGIISYQGMSLCETATLHAPGHLADNLTVYTGLSQLTYEGQTYFGYCVDIDHYAGTGEASVSSVNDLHNGDKVAYLFDTYGPSADTALKAASLELAIWEVLNENGKFDLTTGDFWASSGDGSLIASANELLKNIPSGYVARSSTCVINGDNVQDFVVRGNLEVPEPTTLALVVMGMLVVCRRRKASAVCNGQE